MPMAGSEQNSVDHNQPTRLQKRSSSSTWHYIIWRRQEVPLFGRKLKMITFYPRDHQNKCVHFGNCMLMLVSRSTWEMRSRNAPDTVTILLRYLKWSLKVWTLQCKRSFLSRLKTQVLSKFKREISTKWIRSINRWVLVILTQYLTGLRKSTPTKI